MHFVEQKLFEICIMSVLLVFVLKFTRHVVTSGCPMEFVPVTKWYWWNWFYIYGFYTLVFNLFSVSLFIQHSSCCRSLAAQWSLFRQPELLFCWHFVSWLLYWGLDPILYFVAFAWKLGDLSPNTVMSSNRCWFEKLLLYCTLPGYSEVVPIRNKFKMLLIWKVTPILYFVAVLW